MYPVSGFLWFKFEGSQDRDIKEVVVEHYGTHFTDSPFGSFLSYGFLN